MKLILKCETFACLSKADTVLQMFIVSRIYPDEYIVRLL